MQRKYLIALIVIQFSCSEGYDPKNYTIEEGDSLEYIDDYVQVLKYYPGKKNTKSYFSMMDGKVIGHVYDYYNLYDTVIRAADSIVPHPYLAVEYRLKDYYFVMAEKQRFHIHFSKEGEIENWKGNPGLALFYLKEKYYLLKEKYYLEDTMKITVQLPSIEWLDFKLSLVKFNSGKTIFLDSLKILEGHRTRISHVLTTSGKHSFGVRYKVEHKNFSKVGEFVIPTIEVIEK